MEASALTTASHSGLLARRSPLLRLQNDERLVALIRDGHDRAFEVLFDRYQSRLLAFCRHLVGSVQDAEDVLQEVFVAAHTAMLADERTINARPWLYRIARNRCLNFLRRPVADGQDSMDTHPHANGATTLEQVQGREELRAIFSDVGELPETQRTALVLREIDDLSYTEIAQTMGTTMPSVKSLLVRARMSLAEASEARVLTCDEVRLELAEAAEGLSKVSGPVRRHVRGCARCRRYRGELRSSSKAVAALAPLGLFSLVHKLFGAKLGGSAAGGSAGTAGAGGAGSAGGAAAAAGGAGFGSAAIAGGGAAGIGALGAKAAVGMATAALITAGTVGVNNFNSTNARDSVPTESTTAIQPAGHWQPIHKAAHDTSSAPTRPVASQAPQPAPAPAATTNAPAKKAPAAAPAAPPPAAPSTDSTADTSTADTTVGGSSADDGTTTDPAPPPPDPVPVTPTDPVPPPDVTPTDPAPPPDPSTPPPDDSPPPDSTATGPPSA